MQDDTERAIEDAEEQRERAERLAFEVRGLFSPAAPISHRELFAGRNGQMNDLIDVLHQG